LKPSQNPALACIPSAVRRFVARPIAPRIRRFKAGTPSVDHLEKTLPMKIHEYQGKELLRQFGVPVPR